jgi:CubicO group peptidase (beta-lactamase class C family)
VAKLAADGGFSGVVLLSHRGETVLSRSYGMADAERGVANREGTAFSLSSAGKPFVPVAILQLAQQGKLQLTDTVGTHLTGFPKGIADQVTIHHLLSSTSGLVAADEDVRRVFTSREEVHQYYTRWARQSTQAAAPGASDNHSAPDIVIPAMVVEAVTGKTYWDYAQENIIKRAGMTGSAFYTRPQWLTDAHIAHPYMKLADGSVVDAIRNLDKGSPYPDELGENPGRAFIAGLGDGCFATAPDLVRFAHALVDGTLLDRPWADVLMAPRQPVGPGGFVGYDIPATIVKGQWQYQRAGANPGVGANWSFYPDTGWVGVILVNRDADGGSLRDIIGRQQQAITGVPPAGGSGGGG